MKKRLPMILALTLFLSGAFLGLMARSDSLAQLRNANGISDRTDGIAAEIITDLACLQRLRAGETNEAIAVLELRIDGAMGLLADGLSLIPSSQRDPQQLQVIRSYRHYRHQFPLTNSPAYPFKTAIPPGVKEGIARAYALVPEENGGR